MTHPNIRRGKVLRWNILVILARHEEAGLPAPTLRELAALLGLWSHSAADHHLRYLRRKGLVRRDPWLSRALVLTDAGRRFLADAVVEGPGAMERAA